ncbi:peptidase S8/S53 domain-containing protein [Fimicolochytrium jonesii]|uniref:peptidase S8/S53 domain-containing protein n=1 Tax=Fimicolochytrium jonesii TaxID=1396493 RepID=UPI0022FDBB86|nr:peptidase S8/S53 domain-containing protein [Fimicolochytrium jonesii]KAI8816037.1 peptidase S8/S53 domain-containing protein [Fimicolochytrium jonesii]
MHSLATLIARAFLLLLLLSSDTVFRPIHDCVAEAAAASSSPPVRRQWAVQLHDPTTAEAYSPEQAEEYAKEHGFFSLGQVGALDGYFLFEVDICHADGDDGDTCADVAPDDNEVGNEEQPPRRRTPDEMHTLLLDHPSVRWFEAQTPRQLHKRTNNKPDFLKFPDPLFPQQWHLYNDGVNGAFPTHDINVMPVWVRGINGSGVTVSIVDDGVQFDHPDLRDAWFEEASYDFNLRNTRPLPETGDDNHGTRCAGQIAAAPNNVCGVGVSYGVRLAAQRLIGNTTTDAVEAQALNYHFDDIDIYSSSWGPEDDGESLDGPGTLATAALVAGVTKGRRGLGNIYVFASGNGGMEGDNCNFDSYANSIYTVSIGAITNIGDLPYYAEQCSAHLAVTYSGGHGLAITTTDAGPGAPCTSSHSGTSAAAPLASGMIALMLSVRPNLGWRDVQHLLVTTAKPIDAKDEGWATNGAGRPVSHKYGFGSLDATLLVDAAEKHTLLPHPAIKVVKTSTAPVSITPKQSFIQSATTSIDVTLEDTAGLTSLEHVQVTVRLRHPHRKFLTIKLTSPSKTVSYLAAPRIKDESNAGLNPWTFMTVHNWGENPVGKWTLQIDDLRTGDTDPYTGEPFSRGELLQWTLVMQGTCAERDVVVTPGQVQAGGRTCVHSVEADKRQRNVIGLVFFGAAVMMTVGGFFFWRRTRGPAVVGGGGGWTKLDTTGSAGDLESPTRTGPLPTLNYSYLDDMRSPVDIESPAPQPPGARELPTSSSGSGFLRSLSIEMLNVRMSRPGEALPSPNVATLNNPPLPAPEASEGSPSRSSVTSGGSPNQYLRNPQGLLPPPPPPPQRPENLNPSRFNTPRTEYLKRPATPSSPSAPSPLSRSWTPSPSTNPIATPPRNSTTAAPPPQRVPILSAPPASSNSSSPNLERKAVPSVGGAPTFGTGSSTPPLSRSSSQPNLKRASSAELLKKVKER